MSEKGARAPFALCSFALCSLVLAACGAKTLNFSRSDHGTGGSAIGTGGYGGKGGGPGGGPGTGGAGDTGGTTPGAYVTSSFRGTRPSKIDLLFMIDNSSSMADKQNILADAVPNLVDQLIEPRCIDPATGRTVGNAMNGVCIVGERTFEPVKDIHIGVITSSLGNHGAGGVCEDALDVSLGRSDPHNDDRAHLLARGSGGVPVPTFQTKGFLNYNPGVAGGLVTSADVATPFKEMVRGVGQHGCGYEASLEAVYRFLVDPEPYDTIRIDSIFGGHGIAVLNGVDEALLKQRADFLRPDSLVSVVLVTDENDCSIVDGGQNFYAILPTAPGTGRSVLKPGTSICKTNPNDKCCFNCGLEQPPAGCIPPASDPACQNGELTSSEDPINLRCFRQKERYGADFLYPVQRYIDGFSKAKVPNRKGELVDNPLFVNTACGPTCTARDPSFVFVTGIVGVPWQDIAVDPNDLNKGYKTPAQMRASDAWTDIVGDPLNAAGPVPPRDLHMIESFRPRLGLAGPESGPTADPKHGHEWEPSLDPLRSDTDLQYACIFDLLPPKRCFEPADCDCFGTPSDLATRRNPLCQNAQGEYKDEQLRAKAFPGTRILQVLQGLGDQGTAASICPANIADRNQDNYGYAPAVGAIISRLRNPLRGTCIGSALEVAPNGQTWCSIIEVHNDATCDCNNEPGRFEAPAERITPTMRSKGSCFCEIGQLSGEPLRACKTMLNSANIINGWCYVDPAGDSDASCDIVASCPIGDKRLIRFTSLSSEPRPGSTPFLRCIVPPLTTPPPAVCK